MCFIPNPNNYEEVNHKDEVKSNNVVSNLEWCTRRYNVGYDSITQAAKVLSQTLNKDWEKIKKAINNQLRKYPDGKSCGYKWRYKNV